MYQSHTPAVDADPATRDRTRSAMLPLVLVAVVIVAALVAVTHPVAVGLLTLGVGSTAVAASTAR